MAYSYYRRRGRGRRYRAHRKRVSRALFARRRYGGRYMSKSFARGVKKVIHKEFPIPRKQFEEHVDQDMTVSAALDGQNMGPKNYQVLMADIEPGEEVDQRNGDQVNVKAIQIYCTAGISQFLCRNSVTATGSRNFPIFCRVWLIRYNGEGAPVDADWVRDPAQPWILWSQFPPNQTPSRVDVIWTHEFKFENQYEYKTGFDGEGTVSNEGSMPRISLKRAKKNLYYSKAPLKMYYDPVLEGPQPPIKNRLYAVSQWYTASDGSYFFAPQTFMKGPEVDWDIRFQYYDAGQ